MTFHVKYKELFEVNILHNFFLNKGLLDFNAMNPNEQSKQLDRYDVSRFLRIAPTQETTQTIRGHNLVFKLQNKGFAVWSKVTGNKDKIPFIDLNDDLSFTFYLQIRDYNFYNYTGLNLQNTDKLYYFSNRRLSAEAGVFPLINKSGDQIAISDSAILSGESGMQELKRLNAAEKENLFALVRIFVKGDKGVLNVTNAQGKIKNPYKEFELLFENRKTIWRYIFDNSQTVVALDDVEKENDNAKQLVSKVEQPLTNNGFISLELGGVELPNPDARMIKPNKTNTKYYSEIYM